MWPKLIFEIAENVSKHHVKIKDFGAKGLPKSTKMVPASAPKPTLEPRRQTSDCQTTVLDTSWHHLRDLGDHFESSWVPRGSQNQAFWHQGIPNFEKEINQNEGPEQI